MRCPSRWGRDEPPGADQAPGSNHLRATDGVLTQVHARGLAVLQAARGHLRQQVPKVLFFTPHLHGWDPHRETCSSLFFPFVDQLEEPRDGTGDDAQVLHGVVFANHGVGLSWEGKGRKNSSLSVRISFCSLKNRCPRMQEKGLGSGEWEELKWKDEKYSTITTTKLWQQQQRRQFQVYYWWKGYNKECENLDWCQG